MGALPILIRSVNAQLPDYLPARMVNEFVYCPRLFFYEWVEGVFEESADTVEGAIQHRRVDAKATACSAEAEAARRSDAVRQSIHARSVTLSSERLRVIAKMDLVEAEDGDGRRRWTTSMARRAKGRTGWNSGRPTARSSRVQAIVLRENGYRCDEGVVYYRKTGQRVRVAFDEALMAETEALIRTGVGTGANRARFRRRWWIRRNVRAVRWSGSACRMRRWLTRAEER